MGARVVGAHPGTGGGETDATIGGTISLDLLAFGTGPDEIGGDARAKFDPDGGTGGAGLFTFNGFLHGKSYLGGTALMGANDVAADFFAYTVEPNTAISGPGFQTLLVGGDGGPGDDDLPGGAAGSILMTPGTPGNGTGGTLSGDGGSAGVLGGAPGADGGGGLGALGHAHIDCDGFGLVNIAHGDLTPNPAQNVQIGLDGANYTRVDGGGVLHSLGTYGIMGIARNPEEGYALDVNGRGRFDGQLSATNGSDEFFTANPSDGWIQVATAIGQRMHMGPNVTYPTGIWSSIGFVGVGDGASTPASMGLYDNAGNINVRFDADDGNQNGLLTLTASGNSDEAFQIAYSQGAGMYSLENGLDGRIGIGDLTTDHSVHLYDSNGAATLILYSQTPAGGASADGAIYFGMPSLGDTFVIGQSPTTSAPALWSAVDNPIDIGDSIGDGRIRVMGPGGAPIADFWASHGIGFFDSGPTVQQGVDNVTNNVTAGGTNGTIANFTDLTIFANSAAAIRNNQYQMARSIKQIEDALHAYGLAF